MNPVREGQDFAEVLYMGDVETFDQVYRLYYAPLCLFSGKYVPERDAEDIVNNLFLKLWDKKERFSNYAHVQAFLYLSVRNACLDFLKVSGRRGARYEQIRSMTEVLSRDFEFDMIQNEFWAEIYREIQNLPTQTGKIMTMAYLEGLSNEEVAVVLGISDQTVRNQKVKGLKILRDWAKRQSPPHYYLLFLLFFDQH